MRQDFESFNYVPFGAQWVKTTLGRYCCCLLILLPFSCKG